MKPLSDKRHSTSTIVRVLSVSRIRYYGVPLGLRSSKVLTVMSSNWPATDIEMSVNAQIQIFVERDYN